MRNSDNIQANARNKRSKRWQFSMRAVLFLTTIVALGLLFYQRRIKINWVAENVVENGGKIEYFSDYIPWINEPTDNFFRHVKSVQFGEFGPELVGDETLKQLRQLPYLETVEVSNTSIGELGVKYLDQCQSLKTIKLKNCDIVLRQIGDQTLQQLSQFDTQATLLEIKNSKISAARTTSLNETDFQTIVFTNCQLAVDDLRPINLDLDPRAFYFQKSSLSVEEFVEIFGPVSKHMALSNHIALSQSKSCYAVLDHVPERFDESFFEDFPQLQSLTSYLANPSLLAAIEHCQPGINVDFTSCRNSRLWETVAATPSLTGVTVWSVANKAPIQFTENHQLKSLHVGANRFYENFFAEVGKLDKLQKLSVSNLNDLGTEVRPLTQLPELKELTINNLDSESKQLLKQLQLDKLSIDPSTVLWE